MVLIIKWSKVDDRVEVDSTLHIFVTHTLTSFRLPPSPFISTPSSLAELPQSPE